MIRPATTDDEEWLVQLARDVYPEKFVEDALRGWLRYLGSVSSPDVLFIRGEHGALVAELQTPFYDPRDKSVHLVFCATRPNRTFEGYRMMEVMVKWARSVGASAHFGSQCGSELDSIAKRLGAVLDRPSWTVEAPDGHQEGS